MSFCISVVEALVPRLRAVNCRFTITPRSFFEQTLQTNSAPVTLVYKLHADINIASSDSSHGLTVPMVPAVVP